MVVGLTLACSGDDVGHEPLGSSAGVLGGDGGGLPDKGMTIQDELDLDGRDLDAAQVHGVVHPAQDSVETAGEPLDPIAVPPQRPTGSGVPAKYVSWWSRLSNSVDQPTDGPRGNLHQGRWDCRAHPGSRARPRN